MVWQGGKVPNLYSGVKQILKIICTMQKKCPAKIAGQKVVGARFIAPV
jgi:hypothetical protein